MALTQKLRLKSGHSLWQSRPLAKFPLSKAQRRGGFDVVIVGAGISGAIVAEALTEQGLSVAILDRREPLRGSTLLSTALVQYDIDVPVTKLSAKIGKERARRIWRRSKLALDALKERARYLDIDADCVVTNSLYLDGDVLNSKALFEEYRARKEIGLEVTFLEQPQVERRFGIEGRGAILAYDSLAIDPRRFAAGFLRAAIHRGAKVYSPVDVVGAEMSSSGVTLLTASGKEIRSRSVIFATGYEFLKNIPMKGHSIGSTWATATRPQQRQLWPEHCFIWEASDPYLYMRVSPDFRVICGGEDEEFSNADERDRRMDAKIAAISRKLQRMFPNLDTRPAFAWCGNFGGSKTGTPTIGPVPGMQNCYAVMGYGGNGITFSMMAAQILTSMITGNGDADSDLFSFAR